MRPYIFLTFAGVLFMLSGFISPVKPPLSDKDKEGLMLMREEEKMAFEVYAAMYRKWDHRVFHNIMQSESLHGDLVKGLILEYKLEDPFIAMEGHYKNESLQKMYNDLVKKGENSLIDAFEVGALIEDLDIRDLEKLREQTKNDDIRELYETLLSGSRNHLRAFTRQLNMRNKPYHPAYLSKENYDKILAGDHEVCKYDNTGNGKGRNNRKCCSAKDDAGCSRKGQVKSCNGNQQEYCCHGRTGKKACAGRNNMD